MKKTSLYQNHIELNAKMVPFAGYMMPVQYEGVNLEHLNVRNGVGIFDVSHMGEFLVNGKNATKMLNYLCTNNIEKIDIGKAQYNCMTNKNGGIIDDLIVYKLNNEEYMLVVNASNVEKNWKWIVKHNKRFKNEISNISEKTSLIALQGPKSYELMDEIIDFKSSAMKNYSFVKASIKNCSNTIISRTGYTGSGGFEIYCENHNANKIWNLLLKHGAKYNLMPAGLASRDTLRIEMGYCLYGNDINEETNPVEANLKWITHFDKEFVGKKEIESTFLNNHKKKLVSFIFEEKGVPRKDYNIFNESGKEIGIVTSGTMSPVLKKGIGLGYVENNYEKPGSKIFVQVRGKMITCSVVKAPFVRT